MVVDYSKPQRNGFVEAYVQLKLEQNSTKEGSELRAHAAGLLKGCAVHFRNSLQKILQNRMVVRVEEVDIFKKLIDDLFGDIPVEDFDDKVKNILESFPNCAMWLLWWVDTDIAKMLFPCMQTMDSDLSSQLPRTTNAQESLHWVYYQLGTRNNTIIEGLSSLLLFSQALEVEYDMTLEGIKVFIS